PVPNIGVYGEPPVSGELSRLADAHACFKGIKRPIAEDNDGDNMVAYVLAPTVFYAYEPSMACVAKKRWVPEGFVFVVYVRLDEPCETSPSEVKGVVTHWQFVECDAS